MKRMHFRNIGRSKFPSMTVACGSPAEWTRNTTSDTTKVDCQRCKETNSFVAAQYRKTAEAERDSTGGATE